MSPLYRLLLVFLLRKNILLFGLLISSFASAMAIASNEEYELFNGRYHAVFEIKKERLHDKYTPDTHSQQLGVLGWERIKALFPPQYREGIIQFNVMAGRRWAGQFSGDGENDIGRKGYRLSIAKYLLEKENNLRLSHRPVTARRATLDWTLVHEMGHYICLTRNAIELFSQSFDGDMVEQPPRRKRPLDYPVDGSPKLDGNFVTSYAERVGGDEEVVESFTTYMTVKKLPTNNSLAARKIRFFDSLEGFPELRQHIQSISKN
ncbi:hypothetical protein ACVBE9_05690 [Eionea flava]